MAHCTRDHKTMTWIVFISRSVFFYKSTWTAENGLSFYLSLYFEAKDRCAQQTILKFKTKKKHSIRLHTTDWMKMSIFTAAAAAVMKCLLLREQIFLFETGFACTKNSHLNSISMLDSSIIDRSFSLLHFTDFLTIFFPLFFFTDGKFISVKYPFNENKNWMCLCSKAMTYTRHTIR